jgi:hypothetical protein
VNVSVPQDWYAITPGQSVPIPFTGWSTAPAEDWLISIAQSNSTGAFKTSPIAFDAGASVTTSLGSGTKPPCFDRQAMNNGQSGTLTVTAPASAASGDFTVLEIRSFRESPAADAACNQRPEDDLGHLWLVGVYVP